MIFSILIAATYAQKPGKGGNGGYDGRPGEVTQSSKISTSSVIVIVFVVIVVLAAGFILVYCYVTRLYKDAPVPRIAHDVKSQITSIEPKGGSALGALQFGSLGRQRTMSRKFSVKSRLSSTLTEQYYIADIKFDPEWEVDYNALEFISVLGEGAFGRVIKGIANGLPEKQEPSVVAVKMLKGVY